MNIIESVYRKNKNKKKKEKTEKNLISCFLFDYFRFSVRDTVYVGDKQNWWQWWLQRVAKSKYNNKFCKSWKWEWVSRVLFHVVDILVDVDVVVVGYVCECATARVSPADIQPKRRISFHNLRNHVSP